MTVGRAAISAADICTFHSTLQLPAIFWTATFTGAREGQHHQPDQKVVPDRGELPEQHHGKAGQRDRQQDMAVQLEEAAAIDLARIQQFVGDAGIVPAKEQGGDGDAEHTMREDQPRLGAIEPKGLKGPHQRNQDTLIGQEHPEQKEHKIVSNP